MKKDKIITIILVSMILIVIAIIVFFVERLSNSSENEVENFNETNLSTSNHENISQNQNEESQLNQTSSSNNTTASESENQGSEIMNRRNEEIKINIVVNNKNFTATLEHNETTRELISNFPMTLNMSDLHSNEKYNYLDFNLSTKASKPKSINAGDIKLYGNNCLVIFYKSFSNTYSYTDLGKVDNANSFVSELGSGNVSMRFELAN